MDHHVAVIHHNPSAGDGSIDGLRLEVRLLLQAHLDLLDNRTEVRIAEA